MFFAIYTFLLAIAKVPLSLLQAIYRHVLIVAALPLKLPTMIFFLLRSTTSVLLRILNAMISPVLAMASLPLRLLSPILSALGRLVMPIKYLASWVKGSLLTRWGIAITLLLILAIVLVSIAGYHVTECKCSCIRITPFASCGVTTLAITGCLHCDTSRRLEDEVDKSLSALRGKRNKEGFWATVGAGLCVAGHVATGPVFEIISGNGVGAFLKAGRFYCINTAVNTLKKFRANVLVARAPVAHCRCRTKAARRVVSGYCELSGGDLMDGEAVEVEVDKTEIFSWCFEKLSDIFW